MALPEDFDKIFGSTFTGGLTPIPDVDYSKGWEYVGSNPPTKNDFSYLQNFSDLKSQWIYNYITTASNAASRSVGSGTNQVPDMSLFTSSKITSGWQRLPGGLIIQWGQADNAASATSTANYPIAFPNSCLQVSASGFQVAGNVQAYVTINGVANSGFFTWQAFYANGGTAPSLASIAGQVRCKYIAIGW